MTGPAAPVLRERIERLGSVRFDEFVDLALYHPEGGFYVAGGGAGRSRGDFVTSPEVGPLFGAVVANRLDAEWDRLGRPDPFVVVEAAAGRGALAIAVLAAAPRCAAALRYLLVERAATLRERQAEHLALVRPFEVLGPVASEDDPAPPPTAGTGPLVCSLEDLPSEPVAGVVLANELLDNLPFRLVERTPAGWSEVRIGLDGHTFVELPVPADPALAALADRWAPAAATGSRIPLQEAAVEWLRRARTVLTAGSVVVLDYADTTPSLAARPPEEWLRTYARHAAAGSWLEAPGSCDITCEVATDQLGAAAEPDLQVAQADWLRNFGIDALVDEGRRVWAEGAAAGGLAALAGRSRGVEADALLDPTGLGRFTVLEWQVG